MDDFSLRESFYCSFKKKISSLKEYYTNKQNIELDININKPQTRLSLLLKQKFSKPYGHISNTFVPNYSSGEESCMEDIKNEVSINNVLEVLFDPNMIYVVKSKDEFPSNVKAYILLRNVDQWMDAYYVKGFIEMIFKDLNSSVSISEIKILNYGINKSALVYISDKKEAELLKAYFSHPNKAKYPFLNSRGEIIQCFWSYDATEIKDINFYSVILRNIPSSYNTIDKIQYFCFSLLRSSHETNLNDIKKHILFIQNPVLVKSSLCTLITLDSLEACERLCVEVDKRFTNNQNVTKAHLHPKSSKIFKEKQVSLNGYSLALINKTSSINKVNSFTIVKPPVIIPKEEIKKVANDNKSSEEIDNLYTSKIEDLFNEKVVNNNSSSQDQTYKAKDKDDNTKNNLTSLLLMQINKVGKTQSNSQINNPIISANNNIGNSNDDKEFDFDLLNNVSDSLIINNLKIDWSRHIPKQEDLKKDLINSLNDKINDKSKSVPFKPVIKKELKEVKEVKETLNNNKTTQPINVSITNLLKETKNMIENGEIIDTSDFNGKSNKHYRSKYEKSPHRKYRSRSRSNSFRRKDYHTHNKSSYYSNNKYHSTNEYKTDSYSRKDFKPTKAYKNK